MGMAERQRREILQEASEISRRYNRRWVESLVGEELDWDESAEPDMSDEGANQ